MLNEVKHPRGVGILRCAQNDKTPPNPEEPLFYLADHPEEQQVWSGGQPETAYRHFSEWMGRTFAEEIRPLFAPHDPANPLFRPPRALEGMLALLNAPELAGIWDEDETIGWVYQHFTPDELRRAMPGLILRHNLILELRNCSGCLSARRDALQTAQWWFGEDTGHSVSGGLVRTPAAVSVVVW